LKRSILVTGGDGQLGASLLGLPAVEGFELVAPGLDALDFTRPDTIDAVMTGTSWAAVINGAAHTAVDRAEQEPSLAWMINAAAPAQIARHCAALGVPMVQVSTDYVFSGDKDGAYIETDAPGPLGVYGASKAAVIMLTKRMALKLAPDQVMVSAIAPGAFPSDMNVAARDQGDAIAKTIPSGRVGVDEDMAGAAIYLASKAGDYVSGAVVVVDGGVTLVNASASMAD